jgi:hypothetical protein
MAGRREFLGRRVRVPGLAAAFESTARSEHRQRVERPLPLHRARRRSVRDERVRRASLHDRVNEHLFRITVFAIPLAAGLSILWIR